VSSSRWQEPHAGDLVLSPRYARTLRDEEAHVGPGSANQQ
jgi:hypothetical protein